MSNISLSKFVKTLALALALAALAACGGRNEIKGGTAEVVNVPSQYDLVLAADKDGQFDLDGATLAPEDVRGHIRYLNEVNKPVRTVLLKAGEKQKIRNQHIAELAGMARDLKIEAYVQDDDGKLKVIKVVE
jgi:hypothetical protein